MIKNRFFPVFILITFILVILFFQKNKNNPEKKMNHILPQTKIKSLQNAEYKNKKVIGLTPGKETEESKNTFISNTPSPDWEEELKEALLYQAGNSITNIKIKHLDSFIWAHDGVAMHVESVVVSFLNENNQQTSFKALIDAESGKILKNWDQPIVDPGNPRDSFKIKLDPRYHNEN